MQVREKVAKSRNTVFFPMVCGSKSRLAKAAGVEPLLEVEMSKKCTPLRREEHSKSKVQKTDGHGALLGVQMSSRVTGTRDCAPCQK